MPTFKINRSANIRDRGLAIFGENIDGTAGPGDYITFFVEHSQMTLQIAVVEQILTVSGKHYIALFFTYSSKEHEDAARRLTIPQQMAQIKKPTACA